MTALRRVIAIPLCLAWWLVAFIPFITVALGWMLRIVPDGLFEDITDILLWPAEVLLDWAGLLP